MLRQLFSLKGRINRSQYMVDLLLLFGVLLINPLPLLVSLSDLATTLNLLVIIGAFWVMFALTVKRLHDTDRPGDFAIAIIIPVLGWILPIYLLVRKGTEGPNKYGEEPQNKLFH